MIEMMAALFVFAIVTLGVAPLIGASLQGAGRARAITVGKNSAQQAMERVRGLPYFVSYTSQPQKVDLLDLYYPEYVASGVYVTTCDASSTNPACPADLPPGYSMIFEAAFVNPGALDTDGRETFDVVIPPTDYTWQADATTNPNDDIPASPFVRMTIRSSWQYGGTTRTFQETTLLGDRKAGKERVRALGKIDYTVTAETTYVGTVTGRRSALVAQMGSAESATEVRLVSQASQSVRAGDFSLTREATETEPATLVDSLLGANNFYAAPPDQPSALGDSKASDTIVHPDDAIGTIAYLDESNTTGLDTATLKIVSGGELPHAEGEFLVNPDASMFTMWANNQADTGSDATLLLSPNVDGTKPVFSVRPLANESANINAQGHTRATTTGVAEADRKVEAEATTRLGLANIFPVTYKSDQPVVQVRNFSATTTCTSTADAGAAADASYTADLHFLVDADWDFTKTDQENWGGNGSSGTVYRELTVGTVDRSGNAITSDPLDAFGLTAANPRVYEDPASVTNYGSELDVFLFPVVHHEDDHNVDVDLDGQIEADQVVHNHPGYLVSWNSHDSTTVAESEGDGGRVTAARVDGAITINTQPSNDSITETGLLISIGKLACQAVDQR